MTSDLSEFDDEFIAAVGRNRSARREPSARTPCGLRAIEEQRMVSRSIREGWSSKERFPVSATADQIKKQPKKSRTPTDVAMRTAIAGCESDDERVSQRAVANIIRMVEVVQRDQINEVPPTPIGVGVNVSVSGGVGSVIADETSGPKVVLYLPENGRA